MFSYKSVLFIKVSASKFTRSTHCWFTRVVHYCRKRRRSAYE